MANHSRGLLPCAASAAAAVGIPVTDCSFHAAFHSSFWPAAAATVHFLAAAAPPCAAAASPSPRSRRSSSIAVPADTAAAATPLQQRLFPRSTPGKLLQLQPLQQPSVRQPPMTTSNAASSSPTNAEYRGTVSLPQRRSAAATSTPASLTCPPAQLPLAAVPPLPLPRLNSNQGSCSSSSRLAPNAATIAAADQPSRKQPTLPILLRTFNNIGSSKEQLQLFRIKSAPGERSSSCITSTCCSNSSIVAADLPPQQM